MANFSGEMPFVTDEAILACCLITAGCEPMNPSAPCANIYDEEILFKIGGGKRDATTREVIKPSRFAGMQLWDAAQAAWKESAKGDVRYEIRLTARCSDLIKIYRHQCATLLSSDKSSGELILGIIESVVAGAMLKDEAVLRISCINLKTRGEFINCWKNLPPLLRAPRKGKTKISDGTARSQLLDGSYKTVPAKVVVSPGFDAISLNSSEQTRKKMGFA